MSALRLSGNGTSEVFCSSEIPLDVLKLLTLVIKNAVTEEVATPPHKYHKVNLSGKAGAKLASSAEAMSFLAQAGFDTIDGQLILSTTAATVEILGKLPKMPVSAVSPARVSPVPQAEPGVLTMRQEANRKKEEAEKVERMAKYKAKAKKRGADTTVSLKAEARLEKEIQQKKYNDESVANRKLLVKQLEIDKQARKADDWVASAGADKSNGKKVERFRDRFGED